MIVLIYIRKRHEKYSRRQTKTHTSVKNNDNDWPLCVIVCTYDNIWPFCVNPCTIITIGELGGRRSPAVACWASDHWVASSNPLRGKFRH